MTQAPTPGPLSGDEGYDGHYSDCAIHNAPALPVGPCDCGSPFLSPDDIKRAKELRRDPDGEDNERFASWYGDALLDVHALALRQSSMLHRLAPTAPVEASGSEVPEGMMTIADELEDKADELDQMDARGQIWGLEEVSDIMRRAATAIRPQPSGETREAVARIIAEHISGDFDAALQDKQEWKDRSGLGYDCEPLDVNGPFKDNYLDAADAILALLSARPLALGGQQGEASDTAFKIASDLHAAYEQLIYGLPKYLEAENLTDEENMIREAYITLDVTAHRLAALSTTPVAETAGEAEQTALNIICDPGIITGLHTAAEARDWIEKSVRAALLSKKKPTSEEGDARRRLISIIEQWDGESEYDAEDCASLADDILHAFNGSPVLSSPALGYVSADTEAALKAGINRVIYPAPSAHASFPLYAPPVPAQDDDKLRIAVEALEKISNRRSIVFGRGEMSGQEAFGIATEALAALKSEAK